MLATRLHRAQLELQAHRIWLQTFVIGDPPWQTRVSLHQRLSRNRSSATAPRIRNIKYSFPSERAAEAGHRTARTHLPRKRDQSEDVDLRKSLHAAIRSYDIKDAIKSYKELSKTAALSPSELHNLAQCAHECLRREKMKDLDSEGREEINEIVDIAMQLVRDIQSRKLPPNQMANVHLLSLLRESGTRDAALQFWKWLAQQEDEYLHHDVYAAAIELLAIDGAPLEEVESLYQTALTHFPGNFLAYHLSPDAILPDRGAQTTLKGVPTTLLQAIARARLLRGDSKNAYLALDTVFRLYPTSVPPRFIRLFLEERPLSESFTVFAMACRAGSVIKAGMFRGLVSSIHERSTISSVSEHFGVLRVMLAAMYLQLGGGLLVPSNMVSQFVIAVTQIMRLSGISQLDSQHRKHVTEAVMMLVRTSLEIFARYGLLPTISAFNSIISNVAGLGQDPDIIGQVIQDIKALDLQPTTVTRRSILMAAGLNKDIELVEQSWVSLTKAKTAAAADLDVVDFRVLITAAQDVGNIAFAQNKLEAMKYVLNEHEHAGLQQYLAHTRMAPHSASRNSGQAIDYAELMNAMRELQAELAVLDAKTVDRPNVIDHCQDGELSMHLIPPHESLAGLRGSRLRELYDEMTSESRLADSATPSPTTSESTTIVHSWLGSSKINFTYAQLRFLNWSDINFLLALAERHDMAHSAKVDEAIEKGVRPPQREMGLTNEEWATLRTPLGKERVEEGDVSSVHDKEAVHVGINAVKRLRATRDGDLA